MVFASKPFSFLLLLSLIFCTNLELIPLAESANNYTALVYKECAKQSFSDPTRVYAQALSALYGSLVSQANKARFSKTTSGSGQTTISGLFQCKGDLSNSECYTSVSKLPQMTESLCGKTIVVKVQLLGCSILYEVFGFTQISGMELLCKTCGSTTVARSGFEERRDTALSLLEKWESENLGVVVLGRRGRVGEGENINKKCL